MEDGRVLRLVGTCTRKSSKDGKFGMQLSGMSATGAWNHYMSLDANLATGVEEGGRYAVECEVREFQGKLSSGRVLQLRPAPGSSRVAA